MIGAGAATRYWYVEDGRGNVVALVDSTGKTVDRYTYDLWGKPLLATETVAQPYAYAGYWYDRDLTWYWLTTREYDPSLERFIQPDPSMREGTRSYVYVQDDPIGATDPSGLLGDDEEDVPGDDGSGGGGGVRSVFIPSRLRWLKPGTKSDWVLVSHITENDPYYGPLEKVDYNGVTYERATGIWAKLTKSTLKGGQKPTEDPAAWDPSNAWPTGEYSRGHLRARVLGGIGKAVNLVKLFHNYANYRMRNYEDLVIDRVRENHDVYYRVVPLYQGNNPEPWAIEMQAVDATGWYFDVLIENTAAALVLASTSQNIPNLPK